MKLGTCECCGYQPVMVKRYKKDSKKVWDLCRICANTSVGGYEEYSSGHSLEVLATMKMVAWIGNELLSRLPK